MTHLVLLLGGWLPFLAVAGATGGLLALHRRDRRSAAELAELRFRMAQLAHQYRRAAQPEPARPARPPGRPGDEEGIWTAAQVLATLAPDVAAALTPEADRHATSTISAPSGGHVTGGYVTGGYWPMTAEQKAAMDRAEVHRAALSPAQAAGTFTEPVGGILVLPDDVEAIVPVGPVFAGPVEYGTAKPAAGWPHTVVRVARDHAHQLRHLADTQTPRPFAGLGLHAEAEQRVQEARVEVRDGAGRVIARY